MVMLWFSTEQHEKKQWQRQRQQRGTTFNTKVLRNCTPKNNCQLPCNLPITRRILTENVIDDLNNASFKSKESSISYDHISWRNFCTTIFLLVQYCLLVSGNINSSTLEVINNINTTPLSATSPSVVSNNLSSSIEVKNETSRHNVSAKRLYHHQRRQSYEISSSLEARTFDEQSVPFKSTFKSPIDIEHLYNLSLISPFQLSTITTSSHTTEINENRQRPNAALLKKERLGRQAFVTKSSRNNINDDSLQALYTQLEILKPCNRTIDTPLVRRLLSDATKNMEKNLSIYSQLFQLNPTLTYPIQLDALIFNSTITDNPAAFPPDKSTPMYVLKLLCKPTPRWTPIIVYPTRIPNSFLQVQIFDSPKLNACSLSMCSSKCSYTVHNHLHIYAHSCCPHYGPSPLDYTDESNRFCREDLRQFKRIFYAISVLFALGSICTIPLIIRERIRQQQEARGWALMEPFFLGAAFFYMIPLLDWYDAERNSCFVAIWLRIIGFTLFYGSILLKIFRNLQEYRVRKAHHVVVREQDLLKYLIVSLLVSSLALFVWTISSSKNTELWTSSWPQCPMDATAQMWAAWELLALFYGMRLCYKARSSSWVERYQFTLAICLEAIVTLTVNLIRYSLRNAGSNDALFIITIIQLHFTVSVNITAIITPKFLVSSDSSRRSLAMSGISGSGGKAHPSLAKLRDNLVNGTIDFADVPITDMNAEDIRAELKRVYTQLRMYKLKNIYQDNPHISKRKGGGKKIIDKTTSKNRRISIPPPPSNASSNSPKVRRLDEISGSAVVGGANGSGVGIVGDDEKSDLTVESAPHNIYFSTTNKVHFLDTTIANDQSSSVRV